MNAIPCHTFSDLFAIFLRIVFGLVVLGGSSAHAVKRKLGPPIQYALSARLCGQQQWRAENLKRMSEVIQEARQVGVVDRHELLSDQRSVREVGVAIADTTKKMRELKLAAVSCTEQNVVIFSNCMRSLVVGREASTAWGNSDQDCSSPLIDSTLREVEEAMGER